jgi:transposase
VTGQNDRDSKLEALTATRTLNPRPEAVTDPGFTAEAFFDSRDVVQVKYEMVRRVEVEQIPVSQAAAAFGFSRQSLYTARAALAQGGMPALIPAKPGPKSGWKLTEEVLDHLDQVLSGAPATTCRQLAGIVAERFGVSVHPRSVERALARRRASEQPGESDDAGQAGERGPKSR